MGLETIMASWLICTFDSGEISRRFKTTNQQCVRNTHITMFSFSGKTKSASKSSMMSIFCDRAMLDVNIGFRKVLTDGGCNISFDENIVHYALVVLPKRVVVHLYSQQPLSN